MRLRLVNTTAFRLSLIYALLFSLLSTAALGFIYWNSAKEIRGLTDTQIKAETANLMRLYYEGSIHALTTEMNQLNIDPRKRFMLYLLLLREQRDLFGEIFPGESVNYGEPRLATVPLGDVMTISEEQKSQFQLKARISLALLPDGHQILVGKDLLEQQTLLQRILNVILLMTLIVFAFSLALGGLMGYGVLGRINNIRQTVGEIMGGDLSRRMQVTEKNDEFDRLSQALNSMLARIEQLMDSMNQVTDNLAHDLRNPLNRLRNRLEVALIENPDRVGYQRVQQDAIHDIDDIIRTFNALLSIAQAESSRHEHEWNNIDLKNFIGELAELYAIVAEEAGISFTNHVTSSYIIRGDHQLLAQAITNLLDNAMKFTPEGGAITIKATASRRKAILEICDTGPGIPADKREAVFERFTRLDGARSAPGNGLGLSLVKAVVEQHNGTIELLDNSPGLRARMTFDLIEAGLNKKRLSRLPKQSQ